MTHYMNSSGDYLGQFDYDPVDGIVCSAPPSGKAKWVAGAWQMPIVVPQVISKLQAELAAGQAVVDLVEAFMADPSTPWAMRRGWVSAKELYRNSQMVDELAYVLGWTSDQVDALFIAAEKVIA